MAHTARDVATWIGEVLFVRRQTLTQRHAAELVCKLFGSEFVRGRHRLTEPVLREMRTMFGPRLRWNVRRERWSAAGSSRAKGMRSDAAVG